MTLIGKLNTHKNTPTKNEDGFTLIELMIVVVIVGILAAIAIPLFANQQTEAIKSSIKSDVRNTAAQVAQEAFNLRGQDLSTAGIVGTDTKDNLITIQGTWDDFTIKGQNPAVDGFEWCFTSITGKVSDTCSLDPSPQTPSGCVAAEDSAYDQMWDMLSQGFGTGNMSADVATWTNFSTFTACEGEAERAWTDFTNGNGWNSPLA